VSAELAGGRLVIGEGTGTGVPTGGAGVAEAAGAVWARAGGAPRARLRSTAAKIAAAAREINEGFMR
jgi:hypothetical protein